MILQEVHLDGTTYTLIRRADHSKYLAVQGNTSGFEGTPRNDELICDLTPTNAAVLRQRLAWLNPQPLGLTTSAGFGDRLGLATPGHAQSVKGTGIAPIFAQQSVRENTRTRRTPQQVMDDATWGVFESGWQDAWGADADHQKTTTDLDSFIAAGYTFFTIDPGDFVDNAAETDDLSTLQQKVEALEWDILESNPVALCQNYLKPKSWDGLSLNFDEYTLYKATAKYGRAVTHTVKMARHLMSHLTAFDLEMSVDETDLPTSFAEHFYIVSELRRLNIPIVSIAPRFVGRFEKGVDYIGDLAGLEVNIAGHAAIQKYFGQTYKLSLHSGSDKFSVYPIATRYTNGLVHLKTAGTSYLEALRIIAAKEPALFREMLTFAIARYETDRQTYHVSAEVSRLPTNLTDAELPTLLDHFDARQILHVTFGSFLTQYGDLIHHTIRQYEADYQAGLKQHFDKHLSPFVQLAHS
jgi:tagaturonate epimerase